MLQNRMPLRQPRPQPLKSPTAGSCEDESQTAQAPKKFNRSKRFWAIIATLSIISILSALENTVVTTALPYIVTQLDLGPRYIWVTNVFFLTGSVPSSHSSPVPN